MRIVAPRQRRIEGFVGVEIETGDAVFAGFDAVHQFRQAVIAGRAANQAHVRRLLEDFFAFVLRHAAQHAEDFTLGFLPFEIGEPRKDLLLGFVSDAAGVVENEPRRHGVGNFLVTLREQRATHFFAVVNIHLTAESFQIERLFRHGKPNFPKYSSRPGPFPSGEIRVRQASNESGGNTSKAEGKVETAGRLYKESSGLSAIPGAILGHAG